MADESSSDDDPRRLPAGRKADLAAFVSAAGQVTVSKLAQRFDVSTDTIRRDLDQLDAEGILIRTHGGAVSLSQTSRPDTALDMRLRLYASAKDKIATVAATIVENGSVIIINGGTTTLAVARQLRNHRDLTIATNNLRIPAEISPKAFRELYVFGGAVRSITQATTGPVTFQVSPGTADIDIQCDLALIAVGAVSVDGGYSTSNLGDAAMMGEMVARASRVAILADSSKFGRRLFAQVAELGSADYFITDSTPPLDLLEAFAKHKVEVLVAAP